MRKIAFALCGLAFASVAQAHITMKDNTTSPGATYRGAFHVGHGCDGSPTTKLTVSLPPGVSNVQAQPAPDWTLTVDGRTVSWSGYLIVGRMVDLGIVFTAPKTRGPLYLPAVQTCEDGETAWVEIPAAGAAWTSVRHPAPVVYVGVPAPAPDEAAHHH